MAISKLVAGANKEILKLILCIYYLVSFKKDQAGVQALIDSKSKVNAIIPVYTLKLGFKVRPTDIKAQKIDNFIFNTFEIALASF